MNTDRINHILACIGEECGELQQVVGKSLRFGINDTNPHTGDINLDLLKLEFQDIMAVYTMLFTELGVDPDVSPSQIKAKIEKVERYYAHTNRGGS